MKDTIYLILIILIGYFLYSEHTKSPEIKTKFIKGETIIRTKIDTIEKIVEIPKTNIKYIDRFIYKTDTVIKYVESSFKDSTENYLLSIKAFSPLPVDSFIYDLTMYQDSIFIERTDTLKITKEVVKVNWIYVGFGVLLGLVAK